jgi:hypothetical protein
MHAHLVEMSGSNAFTQAQMPKNKKNSQIVNSNLKFNRDFCLIVTPWNGFESVHGFSYEFRNIQCLQYSATQNSCSSIQHQIILIFPHLNNTTITYSFPLPTITCYFLHSSPGAYGIKAPASLKTVQDSQNNSFDDRSHPFYMEPKSYNPNDSMQINYL